MKLETYVATLWAGDNKQLIPQLEKVAREVMVAKKPKPDDFSGDSGVWLRKCFIDAFREAGL